MNKILSIAVCIYLATMLNACTNSKSDEGNPDQAPVESSLDNPDAAAPGGDGKKAATADEAQAGFLDDQLPDDSMGKDGAPAAGKDAGAKTADAGAPAAGADSSGLNLDDPGTPPAAPAASTPPPAADASMASMDAPPPPMDEPAPPVKEPKAKKSKKEKMADSDGGGDLPMKSADDAPKPKAASLAKIKDAPYHEGPQLLNSVYIARPGDDYAKVSTMIYGNEDKVKDLKSANPGMKKLKPGQKVYYNSPKRPQDDSKMMTYYEDSGIPPETYVAKDGDDLKKVAKDLVGYPEGWKEVWATNAVESKGKLPAGTELKYWKGGTAGSVAAAPGAPPPGTPGTPDQASNGTLPPPPNGNMPPPIPGSTAPPPGGPGAPPPPAQAMNGVPPPPPDANMPPPPPPPMPDQAKAGDMPPPPPNGEMAPPPPGGAAGKTADMKKKPGVAPADEGGLDQETMMYLAVAGVVAAGLAGIIIIRKKKANRGAGYEAQVS